MGEPKEPKVPHCRSGRDGDCFWDQCPQERDGEPEKTGRYCPYAAAWEGYYIELTGDPDGRT